MILRFVENKGSQAKTDQMHPKSQTCFFHGARLISEAFLIGRSLCS